MNSIRKILGFVVTALVLAAFALPAAADSGENSGSTSPTTASTAAPAPYHRKDHEPCRGSTGLTCSQSRLPPGVSVTVVYSRSATVNGKPVVYKKPGQGEVKDFH